MLTDAAVKEIECNPTNTNIITEIETEKCASKVDLPADSGPVSIKIVKSLVSMTTQRDIRFQGASLMPQFIEFDMNSDGFGCLCLLSIAPQTIVAGTVADENDGGLAQGLTGGVGNGERPFPPQNGLTYSTWLCVDIFSSPTIDAHPIRLVIQTHIRLYSLMFNEESTNSIFKCFALFIYVIGY